MFWYIIIGCIALLILTYIYYYKKVRKKVINCFDYEFFYKNYKNLNLEDPKNLSLISQKEKIAQLYSGPKNMSIFIDGSQEDKEIAEKELEIYDFLFMVFYFSFVIHKGAILSANEVISIERAINNPNSEERAYLEWYNFSSELTNHYQPDFLIFLDKIKDLSVDVKNRQVYKYFFNKKTELLKEFKIKYPNSKFWRNEIFKN